jgi:hypothetical protein
MHKLKRIEVECRRAPAMTDEVGFSVVPSNESFLL